MLRTLLIYVVLASPFFFACSNDNSIQLSTRIDADLKSLPKSIPIKISVDANRDGMISSADDLNKEWSWKGGGAFVLPNLDDDNQDGKLDCADEEVNGTADEKDLTLVRVFWQENIAHELTEYSLNLQPTSTDAPLRWFLRTDLGWRRVTNTISLMSLMETDATAATLAIESCTFASQQWDGFLNLRVIDNEANLYAEKRLRVSPFLMLPNTESMQTLYVSRDLTGRYQNSSMLFEILLPAFLKGVAVKTYSTDTWQEMWMQDTMEIGYSESPTSRMHVVLNAPRGHDRFGKTLLGPNVGYLEVAETRTQVDVGDAWLDWFGNLEVSPPSEKFPLGRIYYGVNLKTQNLLHPEVVEFLKAQELQHPLSLDTGWLFIKHVDEILSFWPSKKTGQTLAVIPSPALASQILGEEMDETNAEVQARLHGVLNHHSEAQELLEEFGFKPNQLLLLPLLYDLGAHGAIGRWSNPVNAVNMNGYILYGRTGTPELIQTQIQNSLLNNGLKPIKLDDHAYQSRLGNVHCATNTMRLIPKTAFWIHNSQ